MYFGNQRVFHVYHTEYKDTPTQEKNLDITENGEYEVTPDEKLLLSKVIINANVKTPVNLEDKEITENGTYTASEGYDGIGKVVVNIPEIPKQEKTIEITENGTTEILPDEGKVFTKVTANVNVGGGENKLNQLFTKTITEVTAEDTQGATIINRNTFENCVDLKEAIIAEGVVEIGYSVFRFCKNIEHISLPSTLRTIGDTAFCGCWNLEELRLPEGVTALPNSCLYQGTGYTSKTGVFNLYLPSTLNSIGHSQFGLNASSDSPQHPYGDINVYFAAQQGVDAWFAANIGAPEGNLRMYLNDERITTITLPSTITQIISNRFPKGLDVNVVCEGNIKSIQTGGACAGVKRISFLNNTQVPTLIESSYKPTFDINILEQIEIPTALYDSWIVATNWAKYAEYIVTV